MAATAEKINKRAHFAAKVTFNNNNSQFFKSLKRSVDDYFKTTGLKPTGNWKLYHKALVLIPGALIIYVSLLAFSDTMPVVASLSLCALLGLIISAIGFNIMHDGAHGSFSKYKWVNNMAAISLNLLGGSHFMWNMKHNVIHHAYNNIDGLDDDIDIKPWMRMSTTQPKYLMHRYQHIYFWFLYALLYILWIFVLD